MHVPPLPIRRLRPRRAAGFTLIELLVAIAILGILGTVVIKTVWGHIDEAKQTTTKAKLDTVHGQVVMFRRKHNRLPKWPEEMVEPDIQMNNGQAWLNEEDILDAWGHPMELKEGSKSGEFEIVSWGQDGVDSGFGSEGGFDRDISSTRPLEEVESNR